MQIFPDPVRIASNGITLSTHVAGSGDTIILCHGFPEIAYSWRYQFGPLAKAGYHVVAPDQRGYGASDCPPDVIDYDVFHLIDDLVGLLDHFELERAIFVGHDWGALLLWQMALLKPERMRGLITLNVPFAPRRSIDPMVMTREVLGDDFYIVNFQDSDEADRAFDADPERILRAMYRRLPITRAQFDALPKEKRYAFSMLREMRKTDLPGTPLLDEKELRVFVDAFRRSGFTPPINWYRNWSRNWAMTEGVEQTVNVPTLFVGADDDILIGPQHVATMRKYVPDLTTHMIANCSHWTQQEQPAQFNAIMLDWLRQRFPAGSAKQ
ncbi:MAG: alpha/beta hydrolase [Pseudomonadota bacterium]